jgi:hypothetical protein
MKELIAMADHPIFQDNWEPRVGDAVSIHGSEPCVITRLINRKDLCIDYRIFQAYKKNYYYVNEYDNAIYLPSTDDLIERLGGIIGKIEFWPSTINIFSLSEDEIPIGEADTPQKALMKAVMHLEGLTWNGREWE